MSLKAGLMTVVQHWQSWLMIEKQDDYQALMASDTNAPYGSLSPNNLASLARIIKRLIPIPWSKWGPEPMCL